jgi:hypothetical protein
MSEDHDLLIRIDERTEATHKDVEDLKGSFNGLPKRYVTRSEFKPVRSIVYGMAGVILSAALLGVLAMAFGVVG